MKSSLISVDYCIFFAVEALYNKVSWGSLCLVICIVNAVCAYWG